MRFSVCCRSPSDVFAAGSGSLRLYAVRFKENGETAVAVANATVPKQVKMYRDSSILANLNWQSVSGLYKNFSRISYSDYEFLIHLLGGGGEFVKRKHFQESRFCSRKFGTVSTFFLGKWLFVRFPAVPVQNFQGKQSAVSAQKCVKLLVKNRKITNR